MSDQKTVLLVEDSRVSRAIVIGIIREKHPDWIIVEAENGEVGLDKLQSNEIDLIIADINMPKMDGLQFLKKINRDDYPCPIFVLTANIQDSMKKKVEEYGATLFEKPVNDNKVHTILASIE